MPIAEVVAIGTELLLGEISDTNSQYLAKQLRDCGIDHFRTTTVGDNLQRIVSLMQESLSRSDIVITTGGLGPTVDDPTREAAALAFNTHTEFHPELWEQIQQRFFKRSMTISENNKKQALIPAGATVIPNPVGTAPAFIISENGKSLVCLPGVPREMEYLVQNAVIPWLKEHYPLSGIIKARVIHVGAIAESRVDELVSDLEIMTNPSVGLLAHPGIVDIRITAKADTVELADRMIDEIEKTVRQRMGEAIFGVDEETFSSAIHKLMNNLASPIKILCCGFSEESFKPLVHPRITVENLKSDEFTAQFKIEQASTEYNGIILFTCCYSTHPENSKLDCHFHYNDEQDTFVREYMGAPGLREEWAKNLTLNFIRHQLISKVLHEENHD